MIARYGPHPSQVAELFEPEGEPRGVAALLHGGFWRAAYTREFMAPLAVDLARRGYDVWNVEYRRVGAGGGVPETLEDVEAAVRTLCPGALAVGHSAGGQLALWLAGTGGVSAAVSLAGVCDLGEAIRLGIGSGAAADFLGDGDLALADPMRRLPVSVPQVLAHGMEDDVVPVELSRRYADAAGCELIELPGVGHFELIDPRTGAWEAAAARIERLA